MKTAIRRARCTGASLEGGRWGKTRSLPTPDRFGRKLCMLLIRRIYIRHTVRLCTSLIRCLCFVLLRPREFWNLSGMEASSRAGGGATPCSPRGRGFRSGFYWINAYMPPVRWQCIPELLFAYLLIRLPVCQTVKISALFRKYFSGGASETFKAPLNNHDTSNESQTYVRTKYLRHLLILINMSVVLTRLPYLEGLAASCINNCQVAKSFGNEIL